MSKVHAATKLAIIEIAYIMKAPLEFSSNILKYVPNAITIQTSAQNR